MIIAVLGIKPDICNKIKTALPMVIYTIMDRIHYASPQISAEYLVDIWRL